MYGRTRAGILKKNKLTARSPLHTATKNKHYEMEQIIEAIQDLKSEILERFDRRNAQIEKIKQELDNTNKELREMKKRTNGENRRNNW